MSAVAASLSVTLVGSSSHMPPLPAGADVSTKAGLSTKRRFSPEVSTNPPSPPAAPPLAVIVPKNPVIPSAQTITFPPSPAAVASALIVVSASTTVRRAFCTSGFAPWKSPPTRTSPPPSAPEASMSAPFRATFSPRTLTSPPLPPGDLSEASMEPETSVTPAWPSTVTSLALMAPALRAAMENMSPAPSRTVPLPASMEPVFSTPGFSAAVSAEPSSLTITWPPTSSVRSTSLPATMVTRPFSATMEPWFSTWRPIRFTVSPTMVP